MQNIYLSSIDFFLFQIQYQKQPPEVFHKKSVFKNLTKFTWKHLCRSLFFNNIVGIRTTTLLKKRRRRKCFSFNFEKFLRNPFLLNTSGQLLLKYQPWFLRRHSIKMDVVAVVFWFCKNTQFFKKNICTSYLINKTLSKQLKKRILARDVFRTQMKHLRRSFFAKIANA